jgi:D-alanyl-D-alanine carboxypeptidase/D-alanyl-D-alanine carboxypeptidase (penicillin-binding protein 5/6)
MLKKLFTLFLIFTFSISISANTAQQFDNDKSSEKAAYTELGTVIVNAKSAVLIEEKSGKVLFAKNADDMLPIASTTKIMTTLLTLESGSLDDPFIVDKDAIMTEGSTMGLVVGDVVTKRTLCYGMLLPSGNDAANASAVKVAGSYEKFSEMMNERAEKIGMSRTNFISPSGLDDNAESTAYDMALLTKEALRNPDFIEICSKEKALVNFGNPPYDRYLTNTNKLLVQYPNTIGVKTGFTDLAGRCLVSACTKNDITLICVTLNDPDDWRDHGALYDVAFENLENFEIPEPENMFVNVVGLKSDKLPIYSQNKVKVGAFNDDILGNVTYKLVIPPFIYPPKKEENIGFLEYYINSLLVDRVPVFVKTGSTGG